MDTDRRTVRLKQLRHPARLCGRFLEVCWVVILCTSCGWVYEEPSPPEAWQIGVLDALPTGYSGGGIAYETREEAFYDPHRAVYTHWVRGEGPGIRAWWDIRLFEAFTFGQDLDPSTGGSSSPFYAGVRLNVDGGGGDWDFRLEFEDIRALDSPFPPALVGNRLDLSQAFVRLGHEGQRYRLRFGRFRPEIGSGRVIGEQPSIAAGRGMDGMWITFSDHFWYERPFEWTWKVDSLIGWGIRNAPEGPSFDHGPSAYYAVDAAWRRWFPIEVGGGLVFSRSLGDQAGESGSGASGIVTTSGRAGGTGLKRNFEFDVELLLQGGRRGGEPHFAWAFFGSLGRTFPTPWKPRARISLFKGSGDEDPTDGRSNRLLLPEGGLSLDETGLLARCGWPNTGSFQFRLDIQPREDLRFSGSARTYFLDSETDAWIDALGQEVVQDASGSSGSEIGLEVDLWADFLRREGFRVRVGYGWFFPGRFLDAFGLSETNHGAFAELRVLF